MWDHGVRVVPWNMCGGFSALSEALLGIRGSGDESPRDFLGGTGGPVSPLLKEPLGQTPRRIKNVGGWGDYI